MKTHVGTFDGFDLTIADDRRAKLERGALLVDNASGPNGSLSGVHVETIIDCEPRRLWNLLSDYESLPSAIFGLHAADRCGRHDDHDLVRFTMKLPFPVGTVRWVNRIRRFEQAGVHAISWDYVEGDLKSNSGRLVFAQHGCSDRKTYARYYVQVAMRSRLPASAQRLATRWLLPKVVERLRRIAESGTA